jgi:hypothetical protein
MTVLITLTTAGSSTGSFSLYSNVDSYSTPFETGVAKSSLLAGYTSTVVPNGTTTVRVMSTGTCTNYTDISVVPCTTTTTTSTSSTTTTTTTTTPSSVWYQITNCADSSIEYSEEYSFGTFAINDRVTSPGNVWVVTGSVTVDPGGTLYAIFSTGFTNCP